ncbi:hypothetical protein BpHYR1_012413 [Brachionus plicatilis]|uniref:Uncharacterized protein n=1 Tax=Brachionus plicatilis TaxID=10195 RepID=A0A3M7QPT2_BRAPC|nr:hypothetical protein BpHYR1_012413 [Brachionus plicatilis]
MVLVPYGINPNFDIVPRTLSSGNKFRHQNKKDIKKQYSYSYYLLLRMHLSSFCIDLLYRQICFKSVKLDIFFSLIYHRRKTNKKKY